MIAKEINKSIENLNLHLTKSEKTEHWLNFIFLLVLICFIGYISIESAIENKEFSFFALILISAFVLLIRHKIISTRIVVYKLELTEEQFKKANEATAKLNGWSIVSNRKGYFSAIKGTGWQWEGIKITAILKNGKLYLNSMVTPSIRSNPFSFGLNKKNKMKLISQYQSTVKGVDVLMIANKELENREDEFWKESEWTFINIVKRIILYSLSILFITLAIWMISIGKFQGILTGVVLIGLCSVYLYSDIKVILEKKARL